MLLETGDNHTLVVIGGQLYVCGVPIEDKLHTEIFTKVDSDFDGSGIISICCGDSSSYVLTHAGNVFCHGNNDSGQLGIQNLIQSAELKANFDIPSDIPLVNYVSTFTQIPNLSNIKTIGAGHNFFVALTYDGDLYFTGMIGRFNQKKYITTLTKIADQCGKILEVTCDKCSILVLTSTGLWMYDAINGKFIGDDNFKKLSFNKCSFIVDFKISITCAIILTKEEDGYHLYFEDFRVYELDKVLLDAKIIGTGNYYVSYKDSDGSSKMLKLKPNGKYRKVQDDIIHVTVFKSWLGVGHYFYIMENGEVYFKGKHNKGFGVEQTSDFYENRQLHSFLSGKNIGRHPNNIPGKNTKNANLFIMGIFE